uniref:Uncharacterized protein n=1 Tax=Trichogramma kaykai TaxID=54128 RepID=A0ABD2XCC1_9HYME
MKNARKIARTTETRIGSSIKINWSSSRFYLITSLYYSWSTGKLTKCRESLIRSSNVIMLNLPYLALFSRRAHLTLGIIKIFPLLVDRRRWSSGTTRLRVSHERAALLLSFISFFLSSWYISHPELCFFTIFPAFFPRVSNTLRPWIFHK